MLPAQQADYLFASEQIRLRVLDQIPDQLDAGQVLPIENLEQAMSAGGNLSPLVFILWEGDQFEAPNTQAAWATAQTMLQVWTVLLQVRNVSQVDLAARNVDASRLLSRLHVALSGWTPTGAMRPLQRVQGRAAQYRAGVALYPISFSLPLAL